MDARTIAKLEVVSIRRAYLATVQVLKIFS